jgi:hypothetical protein
MSDLFKKLAAEDQHHLQEMGAFAGSPFGGRSLERVIIKFLPVIEALIDQGASEDHLIELFGHVGILVDGRPVAKRTLSKALSRARRSTAGAPRQVMPGGIAARPSRGREGQSRPELSTSSAPVASAPLVCQDAARLGAKRLASLRRAEEEGEM